MKDALPPRHAADLCRVLADAASTNVRTQALAFARDRALPAGPVLYVAAGLRLLAKACAEDPVTGILAFGRDGEIRPAVLAIAAGFVSPMDAVTKVANVLLATTKRPAWMH